MYKRQFIKWQWKKYHTKGAASHLVERPHGKFICRRPSRRQPSDNNHMERTIASCQVVQSTSSISANLVHANTDDKTKHGLFAGLRDLIYGTSRRDPTWRQKGKLSLLHTTGDGVADHFRMAERLFQAGEFVQAGATFRQGFCLLETSILSEPIDVYQALFFDIPYRIPTAALLNVYLSHLHRLLNVKRMGEPIAIIARLMHQAHVGALQPSPIIRQMRTITADYYTDIRGKHDLTSLEARMEALRLHGVDENPEKCKETIQSFDGILTQTVEHFGEFSEEVISVESWKIASSIGLTFTSSAFVQICEAHISRLLRANGNRQQWEWNVETLERYNHTKYYLYKFFMQSGNTGAAVICLKESIAAAEYAAAKANDERWRSSSACQLLQDRLELVDCLCRIGKTDEANDVRASIATSEYLEKVIQNDIAENFDAICSC